MASNYKTASPNKHRQMTTDVKTKKNKNRNQFSFCESHQQNSRYELKPSITRALHTSYHDNLPQNQNSSGDLLNKESKYASYNSLNRSSYLYQENRERIQKIYSKLGNSAVVNSQELQILHNQHRIQVEKLLLEISRLHDTIHDLELSKKTDIQRLKQQYEHLVFLHLNNLKQSQENQSEALLQEIKTLRKDNSKKSSQIQELTKKLIKQQKSHNLQLQSLRNDLRETVSSKNDQLFKMKEDNQHRLTQMKNKNDEDLQQIQQSCQKQLKKLYKQVEEREKVLSDLETNNVSNDKRNQRIIQQIQEEKNRVEQKMNELAEKNQQKYLKLEESIKGLLEKQNQNNQSRQKLQKSVYQSQISNLMMIIKLNGQESLKNQAIFQSKSAQLRIIQSNAEQQLKYFKEILRKQKQNHLKQIEELKVKMAILHQNDIKQLVNLFETKLENVNSENERLNNEIARLRKYTHQESHRWYESKKKYEIKVSKLSVEVMKLKAGFGNLEKDMNEKIENERSALLLTSQNLIRDAELKATNVKFHQDQLRKLRKILELETQQHAKYEQQQKESYKILQQQNKKLNEKIKECFNEQNQMEAQFYQFLHEKDEQIRKLNAITHQLMQKGEENESDEVKELKSHITKLEAELANKDDKIKEFNKKIYSLQRKISDLKSENEQLFLQNQINQEQAKSEYSKIVEQNLGSLKKFYERKIQELESDKEQLILRNSAEADNLSQLIKKYNQLEKGMKEMVRQAKRKSQLEKKILNLGLDNNLVKNKAELFRFHSSQQ